MALILALPAVLDALRGAVCSCTAGTAAGRPVVFAGVEGGGTTWRAAIAVGNPSNIVKRETFETTTPDETLSKIRAWLDAEHYDALGVATFGPIEPLRGRKNYGHITSTPKKFWKDADVLGRIWNKRVPVKFDTDVNAPALAEWMAVGKPQGHTSCAYITVGTGIGVGLVVNSQTVHGLLHPEMGHVLVRRDPDDTFSGHCPYHHDCAEGLVASKALAERAGVPDSALATLPDDHEIWTRTAHVLASLCTTLILTVSPETIVLSGGIMQRRGLFEQIRAETLKQLNGYIQREVLLNSPEAVIKPSKWGNNAGIVGALTLAQLAHQEARTA